MRFLYWALGLFLCSSVLGAQVQDFEAKREQGLKLRMECLEQHSQWLLDHKLLGTRLDFLRMIIQVEPDHAAARRSLGHKPKQRGGWVVPARPKRSSDKSPKDKKREPQQRAKTLKPFVDYHMALLKQAGNDFEQRFLLASDLLAVVPNHPGLHAYLGEVQLERGWVPVETAKAEETEARMHKALKEARATKGKPAEATPKGAAFSLEWKGIMELPFGRVRGTVAKPELEKCAGYVQAVWALFRMLFDSDAELPKRFGIYLMRTEKEGDAFLKGFPAIEEAERGRLLKQRGVWIDRSTEIGHWSTQADERYDAVCRLFLQYLMRESFNVTLEHPWAHEGFGMYLVHEVTGTRKTWFLPCKDLSLWEGDSLKTELLYPGDWKLLGAQFLDNPLRPTVKQLVNVKTSEFRSAHLLYSYLLAAYLTEAYPEQVGALLYEIGDGVPAWTIFKRRLQLSEEALDLRLQLWLRQYAFDHPPKKK